MYLATNFQGTTNAILSELSYLLTRIGIGIAIYFAWCVFSVLVMVGWLAIESHKSHYHFLYAFHPFCDPEFEKYLVSKLPERRMLHIATVLAIIGIIVTALTFVFAPIITAVTVLIFLTSTLLYLFWPLIELNVILLKERFR